MLGRLYFNGRVAIITGAGGGLGREYALLLASRGASIVVNDLGGTTSGEGKSNRAADLVVNEIRSKGGKAVANYDSVENGEAIIKTAIDNFGKIDILINNAGILRDKSFLKMTEQDWDLIHKVHLKGSYLVSKAAWPHFRNQNYGRIIMTSSNAGLYGNFGQANYSAAKLGLLGLSNTLAVEGAKYNIHCNTIVPVAGSRLTRDILPNDLFDTFKPSYVAPVVAWLSHEDCTENGGLFESAGGWVGKYLWKRSIGQAFIPPNKMTIEEVRDNWSKITDMENATSPANIHEHITKLAESISGIQHVIKSESKPKSINSVKKKSDIFKYTPENAILYALGVGVTFNDETLKYLNECDSNFQVLPTFAAVPALEVVIDSNLIQKTLQERGFEFDLTKLLHGEQYIEINKPIPSEGEINSKVNLVDVLDKGSGALIIVEVESFDNEGNLMFYNQISLFLVGLTGIGGPKQSSKQQVKPIMQPPNRPPDSFITEKTSTSQAALYRLSGDKNPLHIDPVFASVAGFKRPILHGLCTFGFAARHILKMYAYDDTTRFKAIKGRFSGVIIPGETIQTQMWNEGSRIYFRCINEDTGKSIIEGGYVDLLPLEQQVKHNQSENTNASEETYFVSDPIFEEIGRRALMVSNVSSKVNCVYQFNIMKDAKLAKSWVLDLKSDIPKVYVGQYNGSPTCTIQISDENMAALALGELDPIKEYLRGTIKIQGNAMATQKLDFLFKLDSTSSGTLKSKL